MHKKITNILSFLLATVLFYFGFLLFLYYYKDDSGQPYIYNTQDYYFQKGGNTYRALNDFHAEKKYDVVVLGASHAYRGYDPRIFARHGFCLYNLGTSNQSIINTYFLAEAYFQKNTPKLVLLDIYDESYLENDLEFESALNLIPNSSGSDVGIYKMAMSLFDFRLFNVCNLTVLNKTTPPVHLHEKEYIYNGYCQKTDSVKETLEMERIPEKVAVTKIYFLRKTLKLLRSKGIQIVAVNHPNPWKNYQNRHESFIKILQPEFKKYDIPIMDYAYSLPLNAKSNYYDYTHLNQAGVNIYNERLLSDLKKNGYLKDLNGLKTK